MICRRKERTRSVKSWKNVIASTTTLEKKGCGGFCVVEEKSCDSIYRSPSPFAWSVFSIQRICIPRTWYRRSIRCRVQADCPCGALLHGAGGESGSFGSNYRRLVLKPRYQRAIHQLSVRPVLGRQSDHDFAGYEPRTLRSCANDDCPFRGVAICPDPRPLRDASLMNWFMFNDTCAPATEESSWGAVKSLYRQIAAQVTLYTLKPEFQPLTESMPLRILWNNSTIIPIMYSGRLE